MVMRQGLPMNDHSPKYKSPSEQTDKINSGQSTTSSVVRFSKIRPRATNASHKANKANKSNISHHMMYPYVSCIMMSHDVFFANHLLGSDLQQKVPFRMQKRWDSILKRSRLYKLLRLQHEAAHALERQVLAHSHRQKKVVAQKYPTGFQQKLGKLELLVLFDHTQLGVFLISKSYATCNSVLC